MFDATQSLQVLISLLSSAPGLRMFKKAYRDNMLYKIQKYEEMLAHSQAQVRRH